jgi:flagellin-like protein
MKKFIRKDDEAVSPVIAVILMVAITVVLAGVLWAMLSSMTTSDEDEALNISIEAPKTKSYGWVCSIASVSGSLTLDEAKFQLRDSDQIVKWNKFTDDASPAGFSKDVSMIYAIPLSGQVTNSTGAAVSAGDNFDDYENCVMAYNDADNDGQVSAGDGVYIYKDPNGDGTVDVSSAYEIRILKGDSLIGKSIL